VDALEHTLHVGIYFRALPSRSSPRHRAISLTTPSSVDAVAVHSRLLTPTTGRSVGFPGDRQELLDHPQILALARVQTMSIPRAAAHESRRATVPTPRAIKILVPLVVLLLMVGSAAAVAVVTRSGGPVTNVKTATETDGAFTQSLAFTDVPGMSRTVNVPAGRGRCSSSRSPACPSAARRRWSAPSAMWM
jgi:hypothetical protein